MKMYPLGNFGLGQCRAMFDAAGLISRITGSSLAEYRSAFSILAWAACADPW